jgi:hypothetical protein
MLLSPARFHPWLCCGSGGTSTPVVKMQGSSLHETYKHCQKARCLLLMLLSVHLRGRVLVSRYRRNGSKVSTEWTYLPTAW